MTSSSTKPTKNDEEVLHQHGRDDGEFVFALDDAKKNEKEDQVKQPPKDAKVRLCCNHECTVCGAFPLDRNTAYISEPMLCNDAAGWDWDRGLFDVVCQMHDDSPKLTPDVAKATVESTTKRLTQMKEQLMRAGLLQHMDQKYSGESVSTARIVAPFYFSELAVGQILGTGGFSTVSEVTAFHPRYAESRKLHPAEELSRRYLSDHATMQPDYPCHDNRNHRGNTLSRSSDYSVPNQLKVPSARYAIKHLRTKLVTCTPDEFKHAAIDLVLEGQLLLVLDHPHIISIRGWSSEGPDAFKSGDPRDFFLVLDKLPESLRDRMWAWKVKLVKYQQRCKRRTGMQWRSLLVISWVRRNLLRRPEKEQSIPLPDKYAVKLQVLLLERLETAANIAQAIQYMHSKRLIHRDLKTANIGFDIYGKVKLFDLGLSRLLPPKNDVKICLSDDRLADETEQRADCMTDAFEMTRVGTRFYMAPEVRHKEPYNLSADVYSFGVILWELLSLSTPRDVYFKKRDLRHQDSKAQHKCTGCSKFSSFEQLVMDGSSSSWLPMCPCWPVGLRELVTSALSSDPGDRPTIENVIAILRHHIDSIRDDLPKLELEQIEQHCATAARRRSTLRLDLSQTNLNCVHDYDDTTSIGDGDPSGSAFAIIGPQTEV